MINLLKKTFNISGCEIAIDPDRSIYHQGDNIKCKISINGSRDYEQTADKITLILEESWQTSNGEHTTTHRKDRVISVVDSNVELKSGSTFNYEFEAQLPSNCRLSDSSDSLGWCLVVKIDVPRAKDPVERLSIEVIPHREFLAIQHTLENTLKFEKKNTFFTSGERFIPPAALKSELDCIDLHFYQDGINTNCELVFDLQEKSIADYFKTIVRLDKVKREISFSQSELLDENLKPKDHIIAKKLSNEIKQVLTNNEN
jgi:hypothetical protein